VRNAMASYSLRGVPASPPTLPTHELRDAATPDFSREWLLSNGAGGFASGTIAGARTRPSHGLLVAPVAGQPHLFWQAIEEEIEHPDRLYLLSTGVWRSGAIDPRGYMHIERFWREGTLPCWHYRIGDVLLEKRIWMVYGQQTTCVQYRLLEAPGPVALVLKVFANSRSYDALTSGDPNWQFEVEAVDNYTLRIAGRPHDTPWYLLSLPAVTSAPELRWAWGCHYDAAAAADQPANEDTFCVCSFHTTLCVGEQHTLIGTLDPPAQVDPNPERGRASEVLRQRRLLERAASDDTAVQQLVLAADQFVVPAVVPTRQGATHNGVAPVALIAAGYPWTGYWCRDALIALPGLLLATRRFEEATGLVRALSKQLRAGLLPDRWPDATSSLHYYNADAALWLIQAVRAYTRASGDRSLAAELYLHMVGIVAAYDQGTQHGIAVDAADGLLAVGSSARLTWMNHHHDGRALVVRDGKPVEVNALWYNALTTLAELAPLAGHANAGEAWRTRAVRVAASFERFWYARGGYLYDVIDGSAGNDPALRPNQIFAIALPDTPVPSARARAVLQAVRAALLTPYGLRTLAPDEAAYVEHDEDGPRSYPHQGSAWAWLLGAYADAQRRVEGQGPSAAELSALLAQLDAGGLGNISERFDGTAPHQARGCVAHALGVAELLRLLATP
jgi:predicted glycogen debranching enzyme